MDISSVAGAIRSLPTNQALVRDLSTALTVDEETVAIMSGCSWGLNYAQFDSSMVI